MPSNPAERAEYQREYQKRRREDPEFRERKRAYNREYLRRRRREEPEYREKHREYTREWLRRNPDAPRREKLRTRYGMELETYEQMVEAQDGKCVLCLNPPPQGRQLVVDHDHATDAIRGLLCHKCNSGLGYLGDDVGRVRRALAYLGG